jgi:hypothetical protein
MAEEAEVDDDEEDRSDERTIRCGGEGMKATRERGEGGRKSKGRKEVK